MGGGERAPRRSRDRVGGPIGNAWAWFNSQPPQTKVMVIGVIVVLGVVIWMMFRKKQPAASSSDTTDVQAGPFSPLGNPGAQGPTGLVSPAPSGPTGAPPFSPAPPIYPTAPPTSPPSGPTGIRANPLNAASQQGSQAQAYRPPVTFQITPVAASRAMQSTGR